MFKKSHVGRPTNEEVASRKRRKIIKIIVPVVIVIAILVVLSTKGFDSLMGNSVVQIYEKAYLLGDLDNSGVVDNQDLEMLTNYLDNPDNDQYVLNEYQLAAGNVYVDDSETNILNQEDARQLKTYIDNKNSTALSGTNFISDIGTKYVCPSDTDIKKYELTSDNKCKVQTIQKEEQTSEETENVESKKESIIATGDNGKAGNDSKIIVEEPQITNDYNYNDKISLKFEFNDSNYYFIRQAYYDAQDENNHGKLNYESDCTKAEKGKKYETILTMGKNNRQMVWKVYSDNKCTNLVETKVSKIYSLLESQIPSEETLAKKEILNQGTLKVEVSQQTQTKVIKKDNLSFIFNFTVPTNDSNYYYKWVVNKDSNETKSNCYKIVNGMNAVHSTIVDSNKIYGRLEIYTNNKCSGSAIKTKNTNIYQIQTSDNTEKEATEESEKVAKNTQVSNSASIIVINQKSSKTYDYGEDVKVKYTTRSTGNQQYYYIIKKYYDYTKLESVGECRALKNNETAEVSLNMIATNRKVKWEIYTDNSCSQKYKEVLSDLYKSKTIKDNNQTVKKIDTDNLSLNINEPITKKIDKGTTVKFYINFNRKNSSIPYYYKWLLYKNDKVVNNPSCKKIDGIMAPMFSVKMNAAEIYGQIAIYSSKEVCEKDKATVVVNATSVQNTSKYNSIVYEKAQVNKNSCSSGELKKKSNGNYYCHIVKTPSYSCTASGYTVAAYQNNSKRKYCRSYVDANLSGYSYNCNNIKGFDGKTGTLTKSQECRIASSCKNGYSVSNGTCRKDIGLKKIASTYECTGGNGYTKVGDGPNSYCITKASVNATAKCKDGYVPHGNRCYYKNTTSSYKATEYSCSGQDYYTYLSGTKCYHTKPTEEVPNYECTITGKTYNSKNHSCYKYDSSKKTYELTKANSVPIYSCSGILGANGMTGKLDGNKCKLVDSVQASCPAGYTVYKSPKSKISYCIKNDFDSVKYQCPKGYTKTGKGSKTICSKIMDK